MRDLPNHQISMPVLVFATTLTLFLGCGESNGIGLDNDTRKSRSVVKTDVSQMLNQAGTRTNGTEKSNRQGQHSIEELKRAIVNVRSMCTNRGFRTFSQVSAIANGICSLEDVDSRKRLSSLYFEHVSLIDPLSCDSKSTARVLNNYVQMLESYEVLLPYLDNPEMPLELMSHCLKSYHQAIIKAGYRREREDGMDLGQWQRVGRVDKTWNYTAGLSRFVNFVTNNVLPDLAENKILGDRYEYWKKRLESDVKTGDCPKGSSQ